MKKNFLIAALLLALPETAGYSSVTLPFVFTPNTSIQSSQVNADFSAVANELNTFESSSNGLTATLSSVLANGNSAGATNINVNENQLLGARVENLANDPATGNAGRLWVNTSTNTLKVDNGPSIVSVGGGVNNLSSVLNAGNSASGSNINMNENQLLNARVENLGSNPATGNAGRIWWDTAVKSIKVDTGTAVQSLTQAQTLSSVLTTGNSAGATNIDFNSNQAKNLVLDKLGADPGSPVTGQVWYNTSTNIPKFFNGSASSSIGNTNTLAQTLVLGNSVGSTAINFNSQQAQNLVLFNNNGSPGTGTQGFIWFDTSVGKVAYETSGSNRTVANTDEAQTFTNKSISGLTNTLSNIQDSSLSGNVALLNSAQTFSAKKIFSSAPQISNIKTAAGTTAGHAIPNGLADDTFVLANATQILQGKQLNGVTVSGTMDLLENQAINFRVENQPTVPAPGNAGRLMLKTNTGELAYDDGTNWRVMSTGPLLTWAQSLLNGSSAGVTNPNFNENQAVAMRLENLSATPAPGNPGRIIYDTSDTNLYYDTGASFVQLLSGAISFAPVGSAPNNNGAIIAGSLITLEAADNTHPGELTAIAQNIGGAKTFSGVQTINAATSINGSADAVQLAVKGNGTQTNVLQSWATSTPTTVATMDNSGRLAVISPSGTAGFSSGGQGGALDWNGVTVLNYVGSQIQTQQPINLFFGSSPGAPSVYFNNETTTGLYRIGANNSGYTVSGSKVLDISSTGLGVTGTLVTSSSDTATAFISASANPATGGALRLASADLISFRNNANTTSVSLSKDASDQLSWAGTSFLSNAGVLLAAGEPAHTGDVTNSAGSLAMTVANSAVTNAKLANMSANTVKANVTGGSAAPTDVAETSASTASTFMVRDSNINVAANAFVGNFTTAATANSTATLTVSSSRIQFFTGTTAGQIVKLPATNTLLQTGDKFEINNTSNQTISVQDSAAGALTTENATTKCIFTALTSASPGTWDSYCVASGGGAGTVTSVAMTVPAEFSVSGSPITTNGTLAITKANETANTIFAGPRIGGAAAAPTFRTGETNDLVYTVTGGSGGGTLTNTVSDLVTQNPGASTPITVTIPAANTMKRPLTIMKTSTDPTSTVTVAATGADTINGLSNFVLTNQYDFVTVLSDATNKYYAIAKTNKLPTVQKFTSGTSQTYTTPTSPVPSYIRVRLAGGGGGGGGGQHTTPATAGGNGTASTFFNMSAGGGTGGSAGAVAGAAGGTSSLGAGAIGTALQGGMGGGGNQATIVGVFATGGMGGSSAFGGAGASSGASLGGSNGVANTGGGGGGGSGASSASGSQGGSGGGSGGYVDGIITSPTTTYTYTVGAGGTAGALGTTGDGAGGAGGSGYIEVTEFYN